MSTIQVLQKATGSVENVLVQEVKSPVATVPEKRHTACDQEMMHAWSIGVTEAGRGTGVSAHDEEQCPPEVYIG